MDIALVERTKARFAKTDIEELNRIHERGGHAPEVFEALEQLLGEQGTNAPARKKHADPDAMKRHHVKRLEKKLDREKLEVRRRSWDVLPLLGLGAILVFGNAAYVLNLDSGLMRTGGVITLLVGFAYFAYSLAREISRFRSTVVSADSEGVKVPHIPSRIEWSEIGEVSIEEGDDMRHLIVRLRDAETFIARRIGLLYESDTHKIRKGGPLVCLNAFEVDQDIDVVASLLRQLAESASPGRT